jgi:3-oxoacyl-[acyl-carrier protein] reductase
MAGRCRAQTARRAATDNSGVAFAQRIQRFCRVHVGRFGGLPKPAYAAVATINAAIVALAKAFSEQGIKDSVQVNSVLPGPVMTGRRRSYLEHWAPLHGMTVEEATQRFPKEAGIARYGQPEEIAELMAFLVSPGAKFMTGAMLRMDGAEVKTF